MQEEVKKIKYTLLAPIGDGKQDVEDDLVTFLENIQNLFYFKYVPSREIINSALSLGVEDNGMSGGCEWEPFEITEKEYREVIDELKARDGFTFKDIPPEINSYDLWHLWVLSEHCGVPLDKQLEFKKQNDKLQAQYDKAVQDGDKEAAEDLYWEIRLLGGEEAEFTMPYLRKNWKKRDDDEEYK